jgi:hypothetical protein
LRGRAGFSRKKCAGLRERPFTCRRDPRISRAVSRMTPRERRCASA